MADPRAVGRSAVGPLGQSAGLGVRLGTLSLKFPVLNPAAPPSTRMRALLRRRFGSTPERERELPRVRGELGGRRGGAGGGRGSDGPPTGTDAPPHRPPSPESRVGRGKERDRSYPARPERDSKEGR